ncbi:uncharacterized protein EV420DRAFT_1128193 [Desarmillaria tabescens]|uniref:Uncharacterized protein n=1 Tax=Armillaria tabescens TaxID=1929756 RepID=A0AA39JDV0_ARMTA|nr:uncharacterized protein EV420DRAFT_1128193 [Desarmillaria tabescens]KAK0440962.1 hypothetical protein EV420DRAFT_1128193 [Desarmillaria tabescens]
MDRSFEREIIPMARSLGMYAPFLDHIHTLNDGQVSHLLREMSCAAGEKGRANMMTQSLERIEEEKAMCKALEKVTCESAPRTPLLCLAPLTLPLSDRTSSPPPVVGRAST